MSQAQEPTEALTGGRLWAATFVLSLANFMVVLDTTIANVSVPHIAGGLAVSPSQGTWVITSYSVAEAITVPLTGWLVQRFGGVKVFVAAMLGFGLFSFLCGVAPSFGTLVMLRVLQGLSGGPIMPVSQTLLLSNFPRERAPQALGVWSMTVVVAPIAGPLLGGTISDTIGWSWIFFINVPVAAAVGSLSWMLLHKHETPIRRAPVDYTGLALLVIWVGALQIMLDKGRELEWFASATIVTLAIVAAIGFASFMIWELTSEHPIVDLKVFRHRGFTVGVTIASVTFGVYFSSVVLLPLWLQTSLGYTATWAGYASAMNGAFAVLTSAIVPRLIGRVDLRVLVSGAVAWMAGVAFWRAHFTTEASFWAIALPFLVQGAAVPFFFVPTTSLTLSSVESQEVASAAGVSNFLRTSSAAFATSIMTTAWDNTTTAKRGELVGRLHEVPATVATLTGHGLAPDQALGQIDRLVQVQATMLATNQLFLAMTFLFLFAASVAWLAPKPRRAAGPAADH